MDTFEALAITTLAVLPGALFTWSFEREVGNWGAGLADRVYRFVGFSAMFHAVFAYPEYLLWTNYLHVADADGQGFHNAFSEGPRSTGGSLWSPLRMSVCPSSWASWRPALPGATDGSHGS